jgi:hypothetical protein
MHHQKIHVSSWADFLIGLLVGAFAVFQLFKSRKEKRDSKD